MFAFSFGPHPILSETKIRIPCMRSGICHAVVMWFVLDLSPGPTLSSGHWDLPTHWRQAVQTMRIPVQLS
jgi:arginine Nomega-methyltransferase